MVAKLVMLGILPLTCFILALRAVVVANIFVFFTFCSQYFWSEHYIQSF